MNEGPPRARRTHDTVIAIAQRFLQAKNHDAYKIALEVLGAHPINHAQFMEFLVQKGSPEDVKAYYFYHETCVLPGNH